jgi:phosphate transport system substrate-binding protein
MAYGYVRLLILVELQWKDVPVRPPTYTSMKKIIILLILDLLLFSITYSQTNKEIVITGARFTYPLIEQWIEKYKDANPSVKVRIEPRTTIDPSQYDLLIEAYEPEIEKKDDREYLYLGRYAILPVANASSDFAKYFQAEGLTGELIRQIFFHDIFSSADRNKEIKWPYNVYTRHQKAGAPKTFARYFGFEQHQIKGKAIAGADEHLIKAILKDSLGVSYANLGLVYDLKSRSPLEGLSILPVDSDDNGRVSKDEKVYWNLDEVITSLEQKNLNNIPVEYFHISIRKRGYNPEALKFLLWVIPNSQEDLHAFGFLKPEQKRFDSEKEKFEQLALK